MTLAALGVWSLLCVLAGHELAVQGLRDRVRAMQEQRAPSDAKTKR